MSYRKSRPAYRRRYSAGAGRQIREQRVEMNRRAENVDAWWERLDSQDAEPWDEWDNKKEGSD